MSSSNYPSANYSRLTGVFDTTILGAEQIVGYISENSGAANSLQFFDGPTSLIHSVAGISTSANLFRPLPAALKNGAGLRVASTDAAVITIVFWL